MKKFLNLLVMFIVIFVTGCGSESETLKFPEFPIASSGIKSEKMDVDVYLDATVSMQGYTTLAAGNVYRTLPDLLYDYHGRDKIL